MLPLPARDRPTQRQPRLVPLRTPHHPALLPALTQLLPAPLEAPTALPPAQGALTLPPRRVRDLPTARHPHPRLPLLIQRPLLLQEDPTAPLPPLPQETLTLLRLLRDIPHR